jgi:hypothetical protein
LRAPALRKAFLLRNAPATEREFNVLRTALDRNLAFRFWPSVGFLPVLKFAARLDGLPEPLRPANERLPRKLGRADDLATEDLDIAGLALK